MKQWLFEQLQPHCGVCAQAGAMPVLRLAEVFSQQGEHILEAMLHCPRCRREYPVLDGIPLLIPGLRAYVTQQLDALLLRHDLPEALESLIGDCCGPASSFDVLRQHLSTYVWGHYGDLDPAEAQPPPLESHLTRLLGEGLTLLGPQALTGQGPVLDVGCSVGRSTFALAAHLAGKPRPVLGIDLSVAMLRVAMRALREGRVRYARRSVGLVYARRDFEIQLEHSAQVDFWACDAQALPFHPESFGLIVSLNVLDCVASPYAQLESLASLLRPEGGLVLGTPFDWSASATPLEGWIGGHSQRGPEGGASELALRALLAQAESGSPLAALTILEERSLPWTVRLHDRARLTYDVLLLALAKQQTLFSR